MNNLQGVFLFPALSIFAIVPKWVIKNSKMAIKNYRSDRSAFRMMSFKEADNANFFDKNVTLTERLHQAYYLIAQAYGFPLNVPPRLDRTRFSSRKMDN